MGLVLQIAELIYFLTGGPVLAYIAFRALKQIEVTRETARTAALRDSIRLAGEQVRVFAIELLPRLDAVYKLIKREEFAFVANARLSVEGNRLVVTGASALSPEGFDQLRPLLPQVLEALNQLETFAFYFTSGIADEQVAYSSVGAAYVSSVKDLVPLMILTSDDEHHQATIKLFHLWRERREKAKLERDRAELEAKARALKPREILPIGTR